MSYDRSGRIWDTETGQQIVTLPGVLSASFSPDAQRIVTASIDGTARIWDVSRSTAMAGQFGVVLTAALARGIGWRTNPELADLPMQDSPDDLYAEALRQLGRADNDPEIAAIAAPAVHAAAP